VRIAIALVLALVGCSDEIRHCVPGEQRACGCPGGSTAAQVCTADGTFGACDCMQPPDAGVPPMPGGFGTSCAIAMCTGGTSPCADGFTCLADTKCDPGAVCTRGCASDADCPPTMFCDATPQCRPRTACSPCMTDDQCGSGSRCATDAHGGRFCGPVCASDADCPQPQADLSGAMPSPFEHCVADPGGHGKVCEPADGFCHGPSAVTAQTGDGQVCSWCRAGLPGDCAVGSCFELLTKERFCSVPCTVSVHWTGTQYTTSNDTCPTGTYCYFGGQDGSICGTDCMVSGGCVGDPTYRFATCYP
jgi:hypothetical protein